MKILKGLFDFLCSYGLAAVLLLFLLLLTLLGTIEQVDRGLFAAQQKYFSSLILIHWFGPIPVPLPGVYLLMILLFVNLLLGGIVRLRRTWSRVGLYVAHGGILFLLLAGFVTYQASEEGHVTLYENESSDEFVSYYEWELAIYRPTRSGEVTEWTIPGKELADLGPDETRRFVSEAIPFDLEVSDFARNARPRPATARDAVPIEGFVLQPLPWDKEAERNAAGLVATLVQSDGHETRAILWGRELHPFITRIDGEDWAVNLRHLRRKMPFTIHLDKFIRDLYPGTRMAKAFKSEVTKIEDGHERQLTIQMNEPLRHEGYTLFQASWGPANARPGDPLFSTFAVVRNPADHWPLVACIIISIGLILHFGWRLVRFLTLQSRRSS